MSRLLNLFLLGALLDLRQITCARIYFSKCGYKGFTCRNSPVLVGKQDVTYQCNEAEGLDVTIFLWQFRAPPTIASFTIKDCDTLRLNFLCTTDGRPIKELKIQNVTNMHIIAAPLTLNPASITFESISNLENIPKATFFQVKQQTFIPSCMNPPEDLSRINFKNVKIGTIETRAFENLTDIEVFRWTNVSVLRIQSSGLKLKSKPNGSVKILNSAVDVMEPLALDITSDNLFLLNNKFTEIQSNAITGRLQSFEYSYNLVNSLHSGGFSIFAQDVEIVGNEFEQLYSGAFQKITPGLLQYSFKNFGKLRFVYSFRNNVIKYADAGSLHPDLTAYKNVAVDLEFSNNSFYCTCESLGWLGSEVSLGVGLVDVKDFHKDVLMPKNNNTCAFASCQLQLEAIKEMVYEKGRCQPMQMEGDEICEILQTPSTEAAQLEELVLPDSTNNVCPAVLWNLLLLVAVTFYL